MQRCEHGSRQEWLLVAAIIGALGAMTVAVAQEPGGEGKGPRDANGSDQRVRITCAQPDLVSGQTLLITRYTEWPRPLLPGVSLPAEVLYVDQGATQRGVRLCVHRLANVTNAGRTSGDVVKGALVTTITTDNFVLSAETPRFELPLPDRFVCEWTAWLKVEEARTFDWCVESDDGSWLWVDGKLAIDNGGEHGMEAKRASVELAAGMHELRVMMFQSGGGFGMKVEQPDPKAKPPYLYRSPGIERIDNSTGFSVDGSCSVALAAGRYRFEVQRVLPDGTLMALTTGVRDVKPGDRIELQVQPPAPVTLSVKAERAQLDRLALRLEGTLEAVSWRRSRDDEQPPLVQLSPGQTYQARLVGRRQGAVGTDHVVLWKSIDAARLSIDTADTWVSECRFEWDDQGHIRPANRVATLYTPEGWGAQKHVKPLSPKALFTNEAGTQPGVQRTVRRLDSLVKGGVAPADLTRGEELTRDVDMQIALGLPGAPSLGQRENVVLEWNGWFRAEKTGPVTFATRSDDGSWLWIDEQLVVDNGGLHGMQTKNGTVQLEKGMHRLRVLFFQAGGGYGLEVGTQPPADEVCFPIEPGTRLITNRRFIEMSYAYDTAANEHIEIRRQPFVLDAEQTVKCGGPLEVSAYAEVMGTWKAKGGSLAWGAELVTPAGHVVHKMDYLPQYVKDTPDGYPDFVRFRQRYSDIQWSAALKRRDGKALPRDTEKLSQSERAALGDVKRLHELLDVELSYQYNGERVTKTVPITPFIQYDSANWCGPGPNCWRGRMLSYLDKMERCYAIGLMFARRAPTPMIYRWYNHFVGAYTLYSNPIEMHMEWFGLRDRSEIYQEPDLLMHEMLHVQGFEHGDSHDRAISQGQRIFNDHHVYLADHPEYEPLPVTIGGVWNR